MECKLQERKLVLEKKLIRLTVLTKNRHKASNHTHGKSFVFLIDGSVNINSMLLSSFNGNNKVFYDLT